MHQVGSKIKHLSGTRVTKTLRSSSFSIVHSLSHLYTTSQLYSNYQCVKYSHFSNPVSRDCSRCFCTSGSKSPDSRGRPGHSSNDSSIDSQSNNVHSPSNEKSTVKQGSTSPGPTTAGVDENSAMKRAPVAGASVASNIGSTFTFAEQKYEDFERYIMNRLHESNQRRFRFILLSSLLLIVWVGVVFGDRIRKDLSEQTAEIAKETLQNEALKVQTQELAMAVVQTVLNDKEITSHAATFLKVASTAPETQQALLQLTLHILQHEHTMKELKVLSKKLLQDLAEDKEMIGQFGALFAQVAAEPQLQAALVALVGQLSKDAEVVQAVTRLATTVMAQKEVIEATNELLTVSSAEVLEDEDIQFQSRVFVSEVMGDDLLQREGGNALWRTISHMLQPGVIRVAGFALIGASVALAKVVLSPY